MSAEPPERPDGRIPRADTGPEDGRLVRRVMGNSQIARAEFVERMKCVPRMLSAKNARLGSPLAECDLEDVAQDTIAAVWRRLPVFEGRSALETWVYKICNLSFLGRTRQMKRRRDMEVMGEDEADGAASDPSRLTTEDAGRVMAVLETLPDEDRRLVERKLFDGETFARLSEECGESANTLKTRYYRALERLERSLRALFGENDG